MAVELVGPRIEQEAKIKQVPRNTNRVISRH
jgi:hypothetical protein